MRIEINRFDLDRECQEQIRQIIMERLEEYLNNFLKKDIEGIVRCYAKEALIKTLSTALFKEGDVTSPTPLFKVVEQNVQEAVARMKDEELKNILIKHLLKHPYS